MGRILVTGPTREPTHALPFLDLKGTYGVDLVQGRDGIPFLRERVEAQLAVACRGIGASPGSLVSLEDGKSLERGDAVKRHGGWSKQSPAQRTGHDLGCFVLAEGGEETSLCCPSLEDHNPTTS